MEDPRQDLRTEFRGGGAVVGFGLPAQQQAGLIWPCISGGGGWRSEDGGRRTKDVAMPEKDMSGGRQVKRARGFA